MKIEVQIKPGSKKDEVLPLGGGKYKVLVKERAVEGRANEALRETLADHFGVSKSKVHLLKGLRSKLKILEIDHAFNRL
jgi:uncharacterized protein YggU (UPF0235/DUF167 family)